VFLSHGAYLQLQTLKQMLIVDAPSNSSGRQVTRAPPVPAKSTQMSPAKHAVQVRPYLCRFNSVTLQAQLPPPQSRLVRSQAFTSQQLPTHYNGAVDSAQPSSSHRSNNSNHCQSTTTADIQMDAVHINARIQTPLKPAMSVRELRSTAQTSNGHMDDVSRPRTASMKNGDR
jgi:hypothetical protein